MSLGKRTYVQVEQSEWDRTLQQAQQLRQVQANLPQMLEAVRREGTAEVRRQFEPLERRQRAYEQALAAASDELRQLEAVTARQMARQRVDMQRELESTAGQLRSETRQLLRQQDTRLSEAIDTERAERQRQIQAQAARIDLIEADQNRQLAYARTLLRDAMVKAGAIRVGRAHEQFRPGSLEQQETIIARAEHELASLNNAQTAIGAAHTALDSLETLNLELQRMEMEWRAWRAAALAGGREILQVAAQNRKVRVADSEGEVIDVDAEVDYWTDGKLTALEQRVNELVAAAADDETPLDTVELRRQVDERLPKLRTELDKIIEEAQINVISSQMRVSLAEEVVLALMERGYVVQAGVYEGEDQREGYVAKVKNKADSEVVIHITPVADKPGENELTISTYPDTAPPHELRNRAREITGVLRANGLQVGIIEETGRQDAIGRDEAQWRQRQRQKT